MFEICFSSHYCVISQNIFLKKLAEKAQTKRAIGLKSGKNEFSGMLIKKTVSFTTSA